ncbi:MAG: cytidine deaminase [Acidobacteria bacterium]|nr:cytidine deaminase [Acidobacteriota bacterium]
MNAEQLVKQAWQARKSAYAPYSGFRVGASVLTQNGQVFLGCNVEVASYGGTICAERVAINSAVAAGALNPGELMAVAVAADTDEPTAPCGICRQTIEEFANESTLIYMTRDGEHVSLQVKHRELLPFSFNRRQFRP